MRISGLIVALLVLTGCQSLTRNNDNAGEPEKVTPVAKIERGLCLFVEPPQGFEHNCDATYWLNAWIDAANQPWLERKQALKALGDTASDTLHAYVLTLPTDTPYQDRLRAQLESHLPDWRVARSERVSSGFYISHAIELVRRG